MFQSVIPVMQIVCVEWSINDVKAGKIEKEEKIWYENRFDWELEKWIWLSLTDF